MSGSLNKVLLIGNLGKDPEAVRFDNGGMIVKFPIATSETYRDREGKDVDRTEWHNIVVGKKGLTEVCEKYLRKGHKIFLEGRIRTRQWTDKEGQTRYSTEIQMDELTMLTSKEEASRMNESQPHSQPTSNPQSSPVNDPGSSDDDDLPF